MVRCIRRPGRWAVKDLLRPAHPGGDAAGWRTFNRLHGLHFLSVFEVFFLPVPCPQSRQRYKAFKEMMEPNSARQEAHILAPRDPSWKLQRIAEQLNQPVLLICRDIAVASGGRLAQGLRKIGAAGVPGLAARMHCRFHSHACCLLLSSHLLWAPCQAASVPPTQPVALLLLNPSGTLLTNCRFCLRGACRSPGQP